MPSAAKKIVDFRSKKDLTTKELKAEKAILEDLRVGQYVEVTIVTPNSKVKKTFMGRIGEFDEENVNLKVNLRKPARSVIVLPSQADGSLDKVSKPIRGLLPTARASQAHN